MVIMAKYQKLMFGAGYELIIQATETKKGNLRIILTQTFPGLLEAKTYFRENRVRIREQGEKLLKN